MKIKRTCDVTTARIFAKDLVNLRQRKIIQVYKRLSSSENENQQGEAGLKIIFERWPVVLTGQTNFSSVMSRF